MATQAEKLPAVASVMPSIEQDVAGVRRMMDALDALMEMLKPDVDYGIIPKTHKPTILQPGAEKLLGMLNCAANVQVIEKMEDWDNGVFAFTVKVSAVHRGTGITFGEGIGTANTRESRYKNQDTFALRNTVLQMATVRGLRACAKRTAMASGRFTMDMEDEIESFASPAQCALIVKLIRSHVFTDEERDKALSFIEGNPTKDRATEFIDRIKARIALVKETEKAQGHPESSPQSVQGTPAVGPAPVQATAPEPEPGAGQQEAEAKTPYAAFLSFVTDSEKNLGKKRVAEILRLKGFNSANSVKPSDTTMQTAIMDELVRAGDKEA